MSGDAAMLLMVAGMHLLGLLCAAALLIPALRGPGTPPPPPGEGGGGGPGHDAPPSGDRPRGGLPLPDGAPARARLRDHRRLADLIPKPERRPAREPVRSPDRVR